MRLTAGRVTAIWLVLHSLRRLGGKATQADLMAYAKRSGLRAGGLPIRDGYSLCLKYGLIQKEDPLEISTLGSEVVALGQDEEPTTEVIRVLVSIIFLKSPPNWVAIWQGNPTLRNMVLPDTDRVLLEFAGLLDHESNDLPASAWWEALKRVPLDVESAGARKLVGNAGEALTVAFERRRLTAEGYPELARRIRWVAQESDAYGFDVLSYNGAASSGDPHSPLAIEVKSMAYPCGGLFRLFLTRHEYDTAKRFGDQYRFHFWDAVRAESLTAPREEPWQRPIGALEPHLPGKNSCEERCEWTEAHLEVSLNA